MQITDLALKIGSADGHPLRLPLGPSVTVFVGPNNSGKSLLLRELATYCRQGVGGTLLDCLQFPAVDEVTAVADLDSISYPLGENENIGDGKRRVRGTIDYADVHMGLYIRGRLNPTQHPHLYAGLYAQHFIRVLDGSSRLNLVGAQTLGDLKRPEGMLARLLLDEPRRKLIRERIQRQLGAYLALDITSTPQISIRLGSSPPPTERSFDDATLEYMKAAQDIHQFSDGVRAFCGLMLNIHAGLTKVLIIDEPEAFLAPPLAHALGKELALGALEENKQVFVATHSANFLMGAISAGATVNIIRLTFDGAVGHARLLAARDLVALMNAPILRSANVLAALFYRGVVVGEGDGDRAFYQECNERMLALADERAATDTLFLNANGKDVVPMIVEPLRRLGIPAASVVDVDVLNQTGDSWTRHLKACGVPVPDHQPFGARRNNAHTALEAVDKAYKRNGGLSLISGDSRAAAEALVADLARYGMFVVKHGEVEAWLANLDAPRGKQTWLRSIFEKMGGDPNRSDYVRPAPGDVWDFIGGLSVWLRDPSRMGMG